MGSSSSKYASESAESALLGNLDDSIHVLLQHDKKMAQKKGLETHCGYIPRQTHPLLKSRIQDDDAKTLDTSSHHASNDVEQLVIKEAEDPDTLLFHVKNHCDTVDRRDRGGFLCRLRGRY